MATIITPGGGNAPENPASPQLHVDSDWKAQAQAEREALALAEAERAAKQAKSTAAAGATAAGASGHPGHPGELTPPDIRSLVDMLAMQAVMYMGGMADKASGKAVFDPEYSRHMIDLLGVLEEKTRGNITPEEEQDLKMVLNELRIRYVELMKLVAQQAATKGASPGAAGSIGTTL